MLVVGNNPQFARLCAAMGVPDRAKDERFATNQARIQHRDALNAILMPVFRGRPKRHWIDAIGAVGVPCGPVNELEEVFAEAQVQERQMVVKMPHSQRSAMPLLANPIKFSETPIEYQLPPPTLGEHTAEVLSTMLGYDENRLHELARQGVI